MAGKLMPLFPIITGLLGILFGLGVAKYLGLGLSVEAQLAILSKQCPDWREVVGWGPNGLVDHNAPYRRWLSRQPISYQQEVNSTLSARKVLRSIQAFEAHSGGIRRVS